MSDEEFDENALKFGEGVEECGVESDRETTPLSSSNKRNKEMPIDRLSELPDSLLVRILSFLYMKEAVRTSVLSKRWKFLWAELPKLEFWEDLEIEKKFDFVSWVNRAIDIRKGGYLDKFVVKLVNYDECFASDVDAWVKFSVKNKVKELNLLLYPRVKCDYYTPPQKMYSCSSLTDLHLTRCIMAFSSIEWKSLTRLSFDDVELNQLLIDEILSSCPVLKSLELEACWGFNRLEINSRCLNNLTVEEPEEEPYLEITAPYISYLNIKVCPEGRKLKLKNISSVVTAFINLFEFDGGCTEELMSNVNVFLENFKHVKKLHVARQCFEVCIYQSSFWYAANVISIKIVLLDLCFKCPFKCFHRDSCLNCSFGVLFHYKLVHEPCKKTGSNRINIYIVQL
ncbi:hypothetical protein ACS0TY_025505 [Phlomoides rotata]